MMDEKIQLKFITPMFGHGAVDKPEIRSASIRGMLHSWFRILGGSYEMERHVFGGIGSNSNASHLMVRVKMENSVARNMPTLPHKNQDTNRSCFPAGTTCEVILKERLGGFKEEERNLLERTIKAWLLMGTLGFRSTRLAGSFVWEWEKFPMPTSREEYLNACRGVLLDAAPVKFDILNLVFAEDQAEKARRLVSDSLGGNKKPADGVDLQQLHFPLGKINGGRKTSPLKYRLVKLDKGFQILAWWDNREKVTGNTEDDLYGIIDAFAKRKPALGELLKESCLYL